MLELESVCVSVGTFRLRDVSLAVAEGECHAVLGPSGSGKSTLLHAVLGVAPLESGCIRLDGADLADVPIEHRGIGFVPQQLGLFPHLKVRDNLAYSARARRLPPEQYQPIVDRLVESTGIGPFLDRWPSSLSGGERQRVGLVRALTAQPRLVLFDEPFTALDESLRRELWEVLRDLQRQWRLTVLLVTHDLREVDALASRVTVILNGQVAQQGEIAEVNGRPANGQVARFLGVETLLPGRILEVRQTEVTVEVGAARLTAPASPGQPREVLICIRGEDVRLEPPNAASGEAENRLDARVVSMQYGRLFFGVELDAGFPLFAYVTRPACEQLGLHPGASVSAIVKKSAVHLLPGD